MHLLRLGDPQARRGGQRTHRIGRRRIATHDHVAEALAERGTPMAVVSSSANATQVMAAAGIDHFIQVVVDGRLARAEGIPGKPAPDTFLVACERLGAVPHDAAVLEDATSGVQAGAAGAFTFVSTAGGAFLEWMEGRELPGVAALAR